MGVGEWQRYWFRIYCSTLLRVISVYGIIISVNPMITRNKSIMKTTVRTLLKEQENSELYDYAYGCMVLSRRLYNAALFRLRQNFTARKKDVLTANEKQVMDEIMLTVQSSNMKAPKAVVSYQFLEKLMRVKENPDFFSGLPMQTAQEVLKQAVRSFKGWISALREYKKDPSGFTGRPKMPKYMKPDKLSTVVFTNQDCVLYIKESQSRLKFPKTKATVAGIVPPENSRLMEVKMKPFHGRILLLCTFEVPDPEIESPGPYACGLDFGVSNTVALVSNNRLAVLYKGGFIKAANQWYNKRSAELKGIMMKGKDPSKASGHAKTAQLDALSLKRANILHDAMHKISADIVKTCCQNGIGTIVMGVNQGWKQNINIGRTNNQNFVQIPLFMLQAMITYKAERAGIRIIRQEESYTSKADLLSMDTIPVYGDANEPSFSGKRIFRGLYRSADGTVVNADLNGAGNILRIAIPAAFSCDTDFSFLQHVRVHDILPHVKCKAKQPRHRRDRKVLAAA